MCVCLQNCAVQVLTVSDWDIQLNINEVSRSRNSNVRVSFKPLLSNNLMFFRVRARIWNMCSEFSGKNVQSVSNEACFKRASSSVQSDTKKYEGELLYEKAIATLNTIQTLKDSGAKEDTKQRARLTQAMKFAEMRNLPVDHLDKLAAIHVGGTKGKGSVCAFCESILRNSGYKTGFYSSPHLFEVRERMRINGKAISKKVFARYFWECWENFEIEKKCYYKTFLVFMAFHVFLKEKVDVAVVEVGCGGEYDVTNVLRHPVVCGITLLDKDHLQSLGGTVESIAWHKSGIFKPQVPAFTVPQDSASMKVLMERARECQTSLNIVPDVSTNSDGNFPVLGIQGKHQHQNASLAVHLCRTWIDRRNEASKTVSNEKEVSERESPSYADEFPLPESFKEGLAKAFWPGRTQCIERDDFTFYLDGAHTRKSIEACTEWFCEKSREEALQKSDKIIAKVLIFNFKGDRNARSLIDPLVKCDFDYVVFCPNLLKDEAQLITSDISNFYTDLETDKMKCHINQDIWREVLSNHKHSNVSPPIHTSELNSRVFTCVSDAFHWVVDDLEHDTSLRDAIGRVDHVQVFVTGSLFLVGMVLKLLEAVDI